MNCISFTILVLVYTVLCLLGMSVVNEIAILILLLMTTCIAIAIFFTNKIPIGSPALRMIVDLAAVIAVVFLIGAPLGFIPLKAGYVLIVLAMILVVYFATFAVMIIKTKADAEDINQQIKKMKRK